MALKPLISLFLCGCLLGCQFPEDHQMVGAWTANRKLTKIPELAIQTMGRRLRNGLHSTQLKLSADHTFILVGFSQLGGKWSFANGELTLTPSPETSPLQLRAETLIQNLRVNRDFTRMDATISTPLGQIVLVLDKTA